MDAIDFLLKTGALEFDKFKQNSSSGFDKFLKIKMSSLGESVGWKLAVSWGTAVLSGPLPKSSL